MLASVAVEALSALGHTHRLAVFRLLVRAGGDGMAAGDIARDLAVPASTLSTHLAILERAGLVGSERVGRSIVYAADYAGMSDLISYLLSDCCQGRPEVCAPLAALARPCPAP